MDVISSFNQVVIDRDALCHNYLLLKKRAGSGVRLLAMVKADAYGHGMVDAAHALSSVGCEDYGVAETREGVSLRRSGIRGNIYVFLGFDLSLVALFFEYGLTPVIYDLESAQALSDAAVKSGQEIKVHLKVDCGMTRLGVFPDEYEAVAAAIKALPGLVLAGVASHFPRADEHQSDHTIGQFADFERLFCRSSEAQNLLKHTANTGALLYFPKTRCDMVRAGIALYGYTPDGVDFEGQGWDGGGLRPVMSFCTRVLQVKTVPRGVGVSYGHTYVTSRETRLAVLPVGYEDGLSRGLSNIGEVLIRGKRAKIRGRICMNLCMVDVSSIEGVQVGDEVVILGRQGRDVISGDEIAGWMESISYEVLCLFGNNNERKCIE